MNSPHSTQTRTRMQSGASWPVEWAGQSKAVVVVRVLSWCYGVAVVLVVVVVVRRRSPCRLWKALSWCLFSLSLLVWADSVRRCGVLNLMVLSVIAEIAVRLTRKVSSRGMRTNWLLWFGDGHVVNAVGQTLDGWFVGQANSVCG